MKNNYLFALLSFCFSALYRLDAQQIWTQGYLISHSGEKREGWIEYLSSGQTNEICHFKAHENAEVEKLKPGEIQEYHFDQAKFTSRQFVLSMSKNEWVFAECMFESAKYSLYRYKKQYIIEDKESKTEPFRFGFTSRAGENEGLAPKDKKDDARLLALTHSLLSALGVPVEKLSSTLPRADRLKSILIDYHTAKNIPFQAYEDVRSELHFTLGWAEPYLVLDKPKIISSDLFDQVPLTNSTHLGLSVPIHLARHPSYDRFSLMALPGIRYSSYNYAQTVSFRSLDFSSKATYMQLGLFVKYNILPAGQKLQMGFHAGANLHLLLELNANLQERYQDNDNNPVVQDRRILSTNSANEVYPLVGLDFGYQMPGGGLIYAGLRKQFVPFNRSFFFGTNQLNAIIESQQPLSIYFGLRPKIRSGLSKLK